MKKIYFFILSVGSASFGRNGLLIAIGWYLTIRTGSIKPISFLLIAQCLSDLFLAKIAGKMADLIEPLKLCAISDLLRSLFCIFGMVAI